MRAPVWGTALLLIAAGCTSSKTSEPTTAAAPDAAVIDEPAEDGGVSLPDAAPAPARLTIEQLAPRLAAVGSAGTVPDEVSVSLAVPVAYESHVVDPRDPEATRVELQPPTAGELRFVTPTTLVFTPNGGFRPATTYTAALTAVGLKDGVLRPADPPRVTFTTPPFQLVHLSPRRTDFPKQQATVDVVFSAAFRPEDLARHAQWTVEGEPLSARAVYRPGTRPNVAEVTITHPKLRPMAQVALSLAPGLPYDGAIGAPAAEASLRLREGPEMEILRVRVREGAAGFYVDVICNDAANGGRRYYWDDEEYRSYHVSRRCLLEPEEARAHVRFDPPVDFRVAPSAAGFRLLGDFARGQYKLRIGAGAKTEDGGFVSKTHDIDLTVPTRSPKLRFVSQGRYLPRDAWSNLAVEHLNVDTLKLTVRHVPRTNLVYWMSGSDENADARVADLVREVEIPLRGEADVESTSWVDLAAVVPEPKPGVYELTAQGNGVTDVRRLLMTDLHLVVKRSRPAPGQAWSRQVWVWALDAHSGRPVDGVDITLLRPSGKKMAGCKTSGRNGCVLAVPEKDLDPTPPFAIVATRGVDFTYLKYSELSTEHPDDPVQGQPYHADRPYDVAIYTDRGVYRPGETAHLVGIVRDGEHAAPPAGVPVELVLNDPREQVARRVVAQTNAAGLVDFDLPFADFAPTGSWSAALNIGGKMVGQHRFNVEAFVPERMKVTVTPVAAALSAGDEAAFAVEARYLFGGSAADSEVTLTCQIVPARFAPPAARDHRFGPADPGSQVVTLGTVSGTLDADGRARLTCPLLEGEATLAGTTGRLEAQAAVFEAGSGRTSQDQASALLHPAAHYIGLRTAAEKAVPGEAVEVDGVVVDWAGQPSAALTEVQVELVRLRGEYGWYFDEALDRESWRRELRHIPEGTVTVPVAEGKFRFTFTPKEEGDALLVKVAGGGTRSELRLRGTWDDYDWWSPWERRTDRTQRPMRPSALSLTVPKSVRTGEKFVVGFEAPYRGQALLTLETDEVVEARWVAVEPGAQQATFTLREFAPNVYLSVFLVKDPHLESREAYLPDRALGTRSIRVEPERFTQTVKMNAPAEVRPHDTLEITLDLGPLDEPTFATVAAVDQGILSLTRFRTPDPAEQLFARRALGIETFDTVGWALKLAAGGPTSRTGGDDEMGEGAIMPVKPVALWSGVVEVPKSGKATVKFEVPQYRGALRVMAVTAGPRRVGRAEAEVLVRDPLVLQTTLPRFLVGGDEVEIPVFVTNLSGQPREVTVTLEAKDLPVPGLSVLETPAEPPLSIAGEPRRTLTLAEGQGGTVVFRARANRLVGGAELKVTANAGDLVSHDSLEVPFLPAGPRERRVQRIPLASGQRVDLRGYLEGWVPTSERSTLWVTNLPHAETFDHLDFLIQYPYGCLEQTSSSTRPLLFVRHFVEQLAPDVVARAGGIDKMVRYGIDRVLSMQTPDGGLGYWPGATQPHAWGTAYATHLLLDARDQGYHVPADRLESVLAWIERSVDNAQDSYGYRDADAYLHYVLARAKRGRKARIQRLIDELPGGLGGPGQERAYLLKAALWLTGDRRYETDLRNLDATAPTDERFTGGGFYSDRRRKGFVLSVFVDLFGHDAAGAPLAETVAAALSEQPSYRYTTQELVWGVTALGKWVQAEAARFPAPTLLAGQKALEPLPAGARPDRAWMVPRASEYGALTLQVPDGEPGPEGEQVPEGEVRDLRLVLATEGIRSDGEMKVGGDGLSVQREWLDGEGDPIDPEAIELGQMVYTRITLTNAGKDAVENVALVDRFPAGFEVENPRLGRGQLPDWVDAEALWSLEHMNIRDDRLEVFGGLRIGDAVQVVYAARAVSAGAFQAPPVEAEAMYDPARWAREAGETVRIRGPWEGLVD